MALLLDGVALITGAGSGIGRECAIAYATEGARGVVLADRNYDAAVEAARQCETFAANAEFKALAVSVDVCDMTSVNDMANKAVDAFGRIDYSVNSAGVGVNEPLAVADAEATEMRRFWEVNVMGTFNCVQAVSRIMKQQSVAVVSDRYGRTRTTSQRVREIGRGVILNLGSANSYMATPNIVQYTTSKHAVLGLTKNAALDLAPYQIRVNAICPGWVRTPMVESAMKGDANLPKMMQSVLPMSRIAEPEEIADIVMFMTSPRASYVTGSGWIVDGGLTLQVQVC